MCIYFLIKNAWRNVQLGLAKMIIKLTASTHCTNLCFMLEMEHARQCSI